jgi:hypothetical protein
VLLVEFVDNLESSAFWTALKNRLFHRGHGDNVVHAPAVASS